jgi:hypothetical protein
MEVVSRWKTSTFHVPTFIYDSMKKKFHEVKMEVAPTVESLDLDPMTCGNMEVIVDTENFQ